MSTLPPPPEMPLVNPPPAQFDFARPFRFVFEDKEWLQKILIGGLFYIAAFLIIGIFFILGYLARLTRNVVAGVERPLPEWDNLGDMFSDGAKLFVVALLYSIPMIFLFGVIMAVVIAAGATNPDSALPGIAMTCSMFLFIPLIFITYFLIPAAMTKVMVTGEIGTALDFAGIVRYIKRNLLNYFLAIVVYMIANMVGQFGIMLLCIGVVFTAFWSIVVATYAFAEVYRLDQARTE